MGIENISIGMTLSTTYPATKLIELSKSQTLSLVDDDRVDVGEIESCFDDGGRHEDIILTFVEVQHDLFQNFTPQLPMCYRDAGLGKQSTEQCKPGLDVIDAVVDKVYLSMTLQLGTNSPRQLLLVEGHQERPDGIPADRGRVDEGDVPDTYDRRFQRARDGRGTESQHIDLSFHLLDLLLVQDAEELFLVDNHQTNVLEVACHIQNLVGTDSDVDTTLVQKFAVGREFPGAYHPREQGNLVSDWLEPGLQVAKVLHRQDGRRSDDGDLLAVCDRARRRPYGHLGLPEADISTHQTIHRLSRLHVAEDVGDSLGLIGCQLVGKSVDDRYLQLWIRLELIALARMALGCRLEPVSYTHLRAH